jgi:sterol desaturase/sphingolipid hydroxylase (fatty acid hydroxylase superfamily)
MDTATLTLSGGTAVVVAFLAMALAEAARPWRPVTELTGLRWLGNIALWGLAIGLNLLIAPALAHATRWLSEVGLLARAPLWLQVALGLPALDALTYALHRALHASEFLWRFHALHHSDPEFDISTTLRHHPVEWMLTVTLVAAVGAAAGLSPAVLILFGWVNLVLQVFNHANTALPGRLATILGQLVVTPELHRVHHSRDPADAARNYGMILSVWDRLFGTLRLQPTPGPEHAEFGFDEFRDRRAQRLDRMLWQPFLIRRG